jgi:hypothetical protein
MKEHAAYVDDSDDSVQGRSVAKPFPDSSQDKKGSSTTSGKFFAESLSQTMGTQMNPGAMLQTSMKQPSARVATKMPGSPLTRKASSRLAMLGPVNSPLPSSSPRRLARTDGRSGTVVIWGDGWARSASPCKLDRDSPGPMPGSPFTPSKAPAIDTVMHPLVDEEEDLSATPRPENAGKPVGFEKPKQDQEFIGHKMLAVCGGFGKLALITDDGMVVQSGDATEDNDAPMEIPDCGSVRQVVAGQKHVLFLDSAGGLYAGGQNTFGQLGFPGEPSVAVPRAVPAFSQRPVAAVACGQHHSLAVTDWGDVYAWGRGSEGQLGCGRFDTIPVPRYVHGLKGQFVDAIACGYMSSMAVTQKGQLYTWGDDTTGQLGLGPKAGRQATPRRVMLAAVPGGAEEDEEGSAFVVRAAGGWGHTCAVTSGGVVWAWGFGGRGQLGLGDFETRAWPSRVRGMLDGVHVRLVTCGGYFSVALSTEGHIYVWGSGAHHRLGLGDDKDRCEPVLATLKGKDITQLAVTEDRVMAFAPAHIMKLSPDCGPLGGGTRVNIAGDGLFDAERIKVSMDMTAAAQEHEQGDDVEARTGTGAGSSAQESLTVYGLESLRSTMAVSQGVEMRFARGALDPFTGMVVFDTPRHDKPTMCLVEVSFDNGETYTSSGRTYTFYAEPSIAAVEPFCRITSGEVLLSLKGPGLQLAGAYTTVRFSAAGVDPVVVSAEWRDEEGALLCWSPPFPKGKVVVEVALNGQQVSPNGCEVIYFEPPKVVRMEPNCCELGQASTRMLMTCSNMVKDLRLRFRGDCFERDVVIEGADMQACDGDDIGSMTFEVPSTPNPQHPTPNPQPPTHTRQRLHKRRPIGETCMALRLRTSEAQSLLA